MKHWNARVRIEETGHDDCDNGTDLFSLFLNLPIDVFAPIETEIDPLEKVIAGSSQLSQKSRQQMVKASLDLLDIQRTIGAEQ